MPRRKSSKKSTKTTINWLSFLFVFVAVITVGLVIILWSITRPFCANSLSCRESFNLKIENNSSGIFEGQKVNPPNIDLQNEKAAPVLGEATGVGEKHIYVDLTSQTLRAYEGDTLYMEVPVSTGKWRATPTGEFTIWEKLRATRMSGGEGADYYNLPNVPYVMFFSGKNAPAGAGFSLHGAYWHNNFGHPMSHGCVNMRQIDAKRLYDWVNPITIGSVTASTVNDPGTKITIYGQAPI